MRAWYIILMRLKKMKNIKNININFFISIFFIFVICQFSYANDDFFMQAKKKYDEKNYNDSKFLFQKNIVFNPKHAKSYLYLAKIFEKEENESEKVKNIRTTLLLEPKNEEAMYMLINYELKKSNYSEVKELKENFTIICDKLCKEIKKIEESLKDIEPKNES